MVQLSQLLLVVILISACGAPAKILTEDKNVQQQPAKDVDRLPIEGEMPSLDGATEWINSKPLTREELRGKVVLIDFWTYTCINWIRTEPYVRAWAEKYADKGFVVIGVHTPEFEFEKNIENVRRMAKELNVGYPIAVDSDYAIWKAFDNQYWPAFYFIDAHGRIRHHQFGEGEYERSEKVIQQLLVEAGSEGIGDDTVSVDGTGIQAGADWNNLRSPENYVGYGRTEDFASPGGVIPNEVSSYLLPTRLNLNEWAVEGQWKIERSAAVLTSSEGRIAYRFHARDLHLVMGPASPDKQIRFRVSIDGQPPGAAHGVDVDEHGNGKVREQRLYQLIRQPGPVVDHQFEIQFFDPNVEVYAFTFG